MKATTVTITHPAKLIYYQPIHKPHANVWFTWFGIMNDLQDTEDAEEDLYKICTRVFKKCPAGRTTPNSRSSRLITPIKLSKKLDSRMPESIPNVKKKHILFQELTKYQQ
jgi:hypothetical protein